MGGVMTMKKMWNNLNIAIKLILVFSMVSVMPLLVMSFVLYHISANSLESTMEETASIFSSQIASDMNGFISDYDALTKSLLVNEGLMDRLDTEIPISQRIENKLFYRELVMRLMTMESEIQSVTIMNEEGGYFQYDRTGRSLSYEELLRQDCEFQASAKFWNLHSDGNNFGGNAIASASVLNAENSIYTNGDRK